MSYNYTNDYSKMQPRFPYDFERNKEIPIYVPINESSKLLHRHDMHIKPELPPHPVEKKYTRKYITTAHSNLKHYERKYIGTAKPPPSKFKTIDHVDNPQNKLHGLPEVKYKAPHSDVYEEFNLKGKTDKDISRSNWLKQNGSLDDLGARTEGHISGLSLDDARGNFMSMYEAQLSGKNSDKKDLHKTLKDKIEKKRKH